MSGGAPGQTGGDLRGQMGADSPRRRRFEAVVDELLRVIEERGLGPGDALPTERDLAAAFGVSRAVLRQAFGILEERGIIDTRRGSGRYLRELGGPGSRRSAGSVRSAGSGLSAGSVRSRVEIASIADVLEARGLLDHQIAGLACERRTAAEAADLARRAARLEGWEDNIAFHAALAACTHNFVLQRMTRELLELSGDLHQRAHYSDPERLAAMREEHELIARAVAARDAEAARPLVAAHLKGTSRLLSGLGE